MRIALLLLALGVAALAVTHHARAVVRELTAGPPGRSAPPAPCAEATAPLAPGETGIALPDGRVLPPLNGVRAGDPIPRVQREPFMPPIGDVVGQWIDARGDAWWITADGSAFTTRWETVRLGDGSVARVVRLDQSDAVDEAVFAKVAAGR